MFVAARPYLLAEPETSDDGSERVPARVARYAWTDHYAPLREGLWAVAHRLRRDGWKAVAFADATPEKFMAEWRLDDGQTAESLLTAHEAAAARTDAVVARADLDADHLLPEAP